VYLSESGRINYVNTYCGRWVGERCPQVLSILFLDYIAFITLSRNFDFKMFICMDGHNIAVKFYKQPDLPLMKIKTLTNLLKWTVTGIPLL